MASSIETTIQRRRIIVQGLVQGVGFRPFVYGLALRQKLTGFVLNDSRGVVIEVEGTLPLLDEFLYALRTELPPLARIDSLTAEIVPSCQDSNFVIAPSHIGSERQALITPDSTVCDDCLHELFDPQNRRYRYPFINCTNCGPRFTIVRDVPYDRSKTTMRAFQMCATCQHEYDDPLNRRFHAQPNACPLCGPHVSLVNLREKVVFAVAEPIVATANLLMDGSLLAIKGLGGYHLACNALDCAAVQRLRQRKHREYKPFALMVANLETARQLCHVSEKEATLLQSHQRPIVLLRRRANCPVAPDVAPQCNTLGIMLPYTPLHHLLLHACAEASEAGQLVVLVMTSGNLSDEPIAYQDDDACERLASIADAMLTHNRAIHMRCDDSVLRVVAGETQFFRRSRGYAPEPLTLSVACPLPLLACGGHLKNTFCLAKQEQLFLSHHIGDLENLETLTSFQEGIQHFQRLFDIHSIAVAYDLHPEYLATKYALDLDIPVKIGVQHHHAHIASVLAEHGLSGSVIGLAADGTGYGTDGAIWGCEIMTADLLGFERLAHLAYVPLPGGDQAIRQPWRCAAVYLERAYGDAFLALDIPFVHRMDHARWQVLKQMIDRGLNCPPTSSMGRLFDAVAAIIGLRNQVFYEGQAAIELEMLAGNSSRQNISLYPFVLGEEYPAQLDVLPMIRAIVSDIQQHVPASVIATRFHLSIAEMLALTCDRVRKQVGLNEVALSGGVFQNRLLLKRLVARLEALAFRVYLNHRVPPNDGGLSFGQLAVAAARLRQTEKKGDDHVSWNSGSGCRNG